jgi:hypothetical protein
MRTIQKHLSFIRAVFSVAERPATKHRRLWISSFTA